MTPRMRRTLFGFDPRAVHEAIDQKAEVHAQKVAALRSSLDTEVAEQEQISQRVRWTEERLQRQEALLAQLEISRRQAALASPLLQELVQRQVRDMDEAAERERQALLQQLSKVNDRIASARKQLNAMIEHLVQLAGAAGPEAAVAGAEGAAPRERVAEPEKKPDTPAQGRVLPFRVQSASAVNAASPASPAGATPEAAPPPDKPEAPANPAATAAAATPPDAPAAAGTAAPATPPDAPAAAGPDAAAAAALPIVPAVPVAPGGPTTPQRRPPSLPFIPPGQKPAQAPPAAWGGSAATAPTSGWRPGHIEAAPSPGPAQPPSTPASAASATSVALAAPAAPAAPAGTGAGAPVPAPTAPATAPAPVPAAATDEAGEVAAGVQARIGSRMMRFMEGKVVGQDLHGVSGNLLAARGTPITADLVERAQSEGVLPTLILHMTWPEETRT